jgi:hypothetical protein
MSSHVFISHSDKDKTYAEMLLKALESRGIKCWIAPRDIPPGGSYADAILTAIEDSACFVLIFTEHSSNSGHVLREVERALKFNKNIVPIRFDKSLPSRSLDYLLATVHWLSVDTRSAMESISRAAERIGTCLPSGPQRASFPPPRADENATALATPHGRTFRLTLISAAIFLLILMAAAAAVTTHLFNRKSRPVYVGERSARPADTTPPPPATPPQPDTSAKTTPQTPIIAQTTGTPIGNFDSIAGNDPQTILRQYFAYFRERDAAAAYNLLSQKFKARFSFKAFSKTFSSTRSMRLIEVSNVGNGKNALTMTVIFEEEDADHQPVQWQGPIEFVRDAAGWRIDTMKDLKRISAPSAQTQLPIATSPPSRLPQHTWERPHIHLQLANQSQMKTAGDLKNQLTNAGYTVVAVEVVAGNVDIPTRTCELRYFTPGDSDEAQRIAHEIEPFLGDTGIVAYIPEDMPYVSHARQYEIWLSSALH